MPASASPNAPISNQSDRLRPRNAGRQMASSSTAPNSRRITTTAHTPDRGNNDAATAEPECTDKAPASTRPTAP